MARNNDVTRKRTWKRRSDVVKRGDTLMENGRENDIIIPVMGATGAGKSTFKNDLLGEDLAVVGHDLQSCTAKLQHFVFNPNQLGNHSTALNNRRLVIVDTPGFDDTYKDDSEILRRIGAWLGESYSYRMKVAGVIYLHDITQTRVRGGTYQNFQMFRKLVGDKSLSSIVLATTKWGNLEESKGRKRESELNNNFWKDMMTRGSSIVRFKKSNSDVIGGQTSWDIVHRIIDHADKPTREPLPPLQIQDELLERQKIIPDTEAGKQLRVTLEQALKELKAEKGTISDRERADELKQRRTIVEQINQLKVPFSKRLLMFFGV